MSAKRWYSDAERLAALAAVKACGGNATHAAARLGMCRTTLSLWVRGKRHKQLFGMTRTVEQQLADALEAVAVRLLAGSADPVADARVLAERLRTPEPEAATCPTSC